MIADIATTADIATVLAELAAVRSELAEVRASLPPRMISLAKAAEALAVDVQTARAMCDRHELVWRKCGRRIVVDAASLRPVRRETVAALAMGARR